MRIKPRAIAAVLCMIFFVGFTVCGVVHSTDKETSEIKQSYPVLAEAEPVIMADLLMESPNLTPEVKNEPDYPLTQEEIDLIALVTMGEAEGETELGKRLVIDTILNRIDHPSFPDTVKLVIEKWIRIDPKNCKYVLKMDIRHFFDSIPHDRLKAKLKKTVHDEKMLELLFRIIDVTEVGIPLGFYTSQWLSNWYLQGLDHFIKEQLCAVHYMRYMDDMVIFGSNKRVLHRMRQAISDYLEMELGLELKANWQVFRFSYGNNQGRDLDFMGFRFYRNRTILRKSIMYKATRKARKISKKEKATILDARQMLSYLGWIDCTDTYLMYRKWIKPCVSFQQLKRKVSRYDKYDEKRVYQKLVSLYTAKGGKSHGVKLQICREHSPTDCT